MESTFLFAVDVSFPFFEHGKELLGIWAKKVE